MKKRILGKTGFEISEIALGTWQVGGGWGGKFDHKNAENILKTAADNGINFFDTADVYDEGESERAVGRFARSHSEKIYVATKCGKRLNPHVDKAFTPQVLRRFIEDSLKNMGLETIDLIQLHCPPTETFYRPEIFESFNEFKKEGKIRNMGVSVETIEEALKAIEYDNVTTIQIVFNMFRQRPAEDLFKKAAEKNVGIIARVPLASGLLTGKYTPSTEFKSGDHRNFNRNGEVFDKGETFSGIDYMRGLEAVEEIKKLFPRASNLAPVAIKWILMFAEISCVIPGASRSDQVLSNIQASELPSLSKEQMLHIRKIYDEYIWPIISKERW